MHHTSDLLGLDQDTQRLIYGYLQNRFATASRADMDRLVERLGENGFVAEQPLPMYLKSEASAAALLRMFSEHVELLDDFEPPVSVLGGAQGTLTMAAGFTADETGDLIRAAKQRSPAVVWSWSSWGTPTSRWRGRRRCTSIPVRGHGLPLCDGRKDGPVERSSQTDCNGTFPYELNYVEIPPRGASTAQLTKYRTRHA